MTTSRCNAHKLRTYSEDGLEMLADLRAKADAAVDALAALRRVRTEGMDEYLPALGEDLDEDITGLVDDWERLDEFAGEVADGFFALRELRPAGDGQGGMDDVVPREVDDAVLRATGIGFPDGVDVGPQSGTESPAQSDYEDLFVGAEGAANHHLYDG